MLGIITAPYPLYSFFPIFAHVVLFSSSANVTHKPAMHFPIGLLVVLLRTIFINKYL